MTNRLLNRRPMKYDYRDFRMADFLSPEKRRAAAQITSTDWAVRRVLDQGTTPHCVGFAWAGFGISLPIFDDWQNDMGNKIYYAAKVIDGEPNQEDGSNTRSGVQAFTQFGKLSQYAFANSMQDVIDWVLTTGPIVGGTNWYDSMMDADSQGYVTITPNASIAGGHEWMISGVDTVKRIFHCTNSWGTSWGINGQFYLTYADYQRLLNEQGDACAAMEVAGTPTPTPVPPTQGCLTAIAKGLRGIAVDPNVATYKRIARAMNLAATDLLKSK